MFTERGPWPGGPQAEFRRRINELEDKIKLGRKRVENATDSLNFTREQSAKILPYETAVEYLAKTRADLRWLLALRQANLPFEIILNIWDQKEETDRKLRDRI